MDSSLRRRRHERPGITSGPLPVSEPVVYTPSSLLHSKAACSFYEPLRCNAKNGSRSPGLARFHLFTVCLWQQSTPRSGDGRQFAQTRGSHFSLVWSSHPGQSACSGDPFTGSHEVCSVTISISHLETGMLACHARLVDMEV